MPSKIDLTALRIGQELKAWANEWCTMEMNMQTLFRRIVSRYQHAATLGNYFPLQTCACTWEGALEPLTLHSRLWYSEGALEPL